MPNIPPRGIYPRLPDGTWNNPELIYARNVAGTAWLTADYVYVAMPGHAQWALIWARVAGSPASVTIAYATSPGTQVNVSWVPSTPSIADSYNVYRSDGSLAGSTVAPGTTFTDTNPRPLNGAYTVKGVLGGTEATIGTASNVLDLRLQPATLNGVVNNGGTATSTVTNTWTHAALGRPDEYDIYRNGVFQATVAGTVLSWIDPSPPRGTVPSYEVRPILTNIDGLGRSDTTSVPAAPPTSVTLVATSSPLSNLRLTWSAPANGVFTAYEVERSPDGVVWTNHTDDVSPSDWGTSSPGRMRVRATSLGGASSWITLGPVSPINDITPPANATITSWKPEASYGRMVVRFSTPAADVHQYKVQQRLAAGAWADVTSWTAAAESTAYAVVCATRVAGNVAEVKVLLRDTALNENTGDTASYTLVASPTIVDPSGDLSGTYRDGAWRNDGVRSTTELATGWTSSGHNIGCYFYGTAIDTALGAKTVVSATIAYYRENEGGLSAGVQPLFWTHNLTGRTAAPVPDAEGVAEASRLGSAVVRQGTGLSSWDSGTFTLPAAFITALQANTAKGLCMYRGYQGSGDPDSYYALLGIGDVTGGSPSIVNGRLTFNHLG